jgi:hypothetical protein
MFARMKVLTADEALVVKRGGNLVGRIVDRHVDTETGANVMIQFL